MAERMQAEAAAETADVKPLTNKDIPADERSYLIKTLTEQMNMASENLQFEKAAALRDQIDELKGVEVKPKATPNRSQRGRR